MRWDGVSQTQEAKQLRDENSRLGKLVADLSLEREALQSRYESLWHRQQRISGLGGNLCAAGCDGFGRNSGIICNIKGEELSAPLVVRCHRS